MCNGALLNTERLSVWPFMRELAWIVMTGPLRPPGGSKVSGRIAALATMILAASAVVANVACGKRVISEVEVGYEDVSRTRPGPRASSWS